MNYDAQKVTYQEVTIFDRPALFTECRIDRTTVPEGVYRYELRHGDEDWGEPVELSRNIVVNYYGTVLTREPFQLPIDGNLCKDCAKQLSPWFSDRRRSTVEDIKRQLAYREENRGRASQFRTTRSYGEDCKVLLDEEHRWFTVTRARDLADANPDILDYTALTGCRVDIDESRTEQKREGPDGKEVSYNPPRYEYSYDFEVIISRIVLNNGS